MKQLLLQAFDGPLKLARALFDAAARPAHAAVVAVAQSHGMATA
jgi:hypothetical protein